MKKSDLNKNPDLLRHYSLRKLSVGVASVVLGTTAVLGAAQTVKADTTNGQIPAEATQTASSTPDSASDGNQGNGNDFNSANAYAAYVLPKGQSESSYVNSFAAQLNQQQTTANQSQIQTQAPSANNANTQAATASSNNVTTAPYAMSVAEANAANNSVNTNSSSTSEQQNSGQAVSSSDYTVTSHKVYKIQGSGEQDRSYVDAHIDLSFTNNQNIKAGDYIDVHLGVQMDDGTEENYSSGLAGASDLTIGGVKIGSIVPENTSTSGYYRIIFNENFSKLVNPTISLDLKWFNQYGNDPIQMVLHTNNKSVTTYTPTNDLKIGDQSFDSGLKDLPVEYLTGNETQKAQPNVVLKSVLLPVHVWVKGQGETDQKLETIARYFLADNMSHDFTISLAAFQNGSLTTNWYSDETVANEIKQALQNYNSYTTTKAHAIDNSDVGTFTQVQNLPAAPEVTVTSDTPTTSTHDSNYAIKKYHIVIGGTDDLKFGQNGYIDLADITSNDGVDVSPSNSSYEADEASRKANKQTYSKSVSADPIVKEWVTNSVYAGPDLNNKALQNTLFSNPAFWTMVHNNTDDTNYQLGGTLEVGPGNFGGSVAQRDTLPTQSGDNTSDVKGEIMATIKYIDDDTGKTLKEDSAHGLIGETIKFPDYDNKLQAYEAQGYEVDKKKTTYTTGATYQADFAKNKFEVHLTKKDTTPTEDTYSKDLIFKDLNNHEVAHVSGAFTGKLTNGAATIPAADINAKIDSNIPKGYTYVSGKLSQPEVITNSNPAAIVVTVKKTEDTLNFHQDIIYKRADGTIVITVPGAITGILTNGQAVVSAADVNSKIDLNLPQGYEYISGKLATDEVVKSQTPTAITVIVQSKTPQQQNFSQNIVYKTGDGIIIKNVTGAMTGKLVNGTATVYASDVNAKIDSNMPQGCHRVMNTSPEN